MLFIGLGILCFGYCAIACMCLIWFLPTASRYTSPPRALRRWTHAGGSVAFAVASFLSVVRAPLGLVPYGIKLLLILGLRIRYEAIRTNYAREVLNLIGDLVNLGVAALVVTLLIVPRHWPIVSIVCWCALGAEATRIVCERVPTLWSAAWQCLPHRQIARFLSARHKQTGSAGRGLSAYCGYYLLDDQARGQALITALQQRATGTGSSDQDPDAAVRLSYLRGISVVPYRQGLRGGHVRDVAHGVIFIHASWSNDPWMLAGMLLRRSPWIFDPRLARRPFYYMSEANPWMSRFVLRHADYSPFFALFQFGHEIRVARLRWWYLALRLLGWDVERKVAADGTFLNDQLIHHLGRALGRADMPPEPRPLLDDDAVLADLLAGGMEITQLTSTALAERHMYPLSYVETVLWPKIYYHLIDARPVPAHQVSSVATAETSSLSAR